MIIKLISMPFGRPMQRSPGEVARYLRDFLNGTGADRDWDEFVSIPIADPNLESLRQRTALLALPLPDPDIRLLQALIIEAEATGTLNGSAGPPSDRHGQRPSGAAPTPP